MAFDLGNFGDGNGYIYEKLKTGEINTLDNTPAIAMNIMNRANKSRIIYTKYTEETAGSFTDQFQDAEYGSRYYLNAEVAAPINDITGAIEITKYTIAPTKCYKDNLTIDVSDEVTIVRYSFIHIVLLTPASGTEGVLNKLNHDLQPGDLVIFTLADDSTDTITINPNTVDSGNFKCQNNRAIILTGAGATALFVRDGSNGQAYGGQGFLREIGRPDENALGIANKTLTSGGGDYYCVDISTPPAARLDTKRGLVILHGNGNTLAAPWNVFGEMVNSAKSEGTTLDIILDSPLITDSLSGATLTIFGIQIPDLYCKYNNFFVRAWFDNSDADPVNWEWKAQMSVSQLPDTVIEFMNDGSDSGNEPYAIWNPDFISAAPGAVACKTISHMEGTEGMVSARGYLVLSAQISGGSSETLGYNILNNWRPNTDGSTNFVCAVSRGGVYVGAVMIQIADAVMVFNPSSLGLAIGDAIYLSSIVYPAYNASW